MRYQTVEMTESKASGPYSEMKAETEERAWGLIRSMSCRCLGVKFSFLIEFAPLMYFLTKFS